MTAYRRSPHLDFIYFDLGKVILKFDHAIACRRIGDRMRLTPEQVHAALFDTGIEVRYETGQLNCDQFHQEFCRAAGGQIEKAELLGWMSDIFAPNLEIFPLLTQLRAANYAIGILSNTCPAHWEYVAAKYKILRDFFSCRVLSYEVRSMKPDAQIFQQAINRSGTEAHRCFFVDDREENVEGALAAGLDAVLYRSVPELLDALTARGIEINL